MRALPVSQRVILRRIDLSLVNSAYCTAQVDKTRIWRSRGNRVSMPAILRTITYRQAIECLSFFELQPLSSRQLRKWQAT